MTHFLLADAPFYRLVPAAWDIPPAWSDAALLTLWMFALLLLVTALVQWRRQRRQMLQALPDCLDLLTAPYPRIPGMEAVLGLMALGLCLGLAPSLGRPGVWQGALLSAYLLGLLVHRHFHPLAGLAVALLATVGMLGFPLALASVLAPPDGPHRLTVQQVLLIGGFTSLIVALVWAVCAGQWARQQVGGSPISTAHRMTWPALIQAIAALILAAFCLAPAFQKQVG